jgi:hypothetical protein
LIEQGQATSSYDIFPSDSSSTSSSTVPQNRQGLEEATLLEEEGLPVVAAKRRKLTGARRVVRGNLREEKGKERLKDDKEQEAEGETNNQNIEQASIETQDLYAKEVKEEEQKIRGYINSLQSSSLRITDRDNGQYSFTFGY